MEPLKQEQTVDLVFSHFWLIKNEEKTIMHLKILFFHPKTTSRIHFFSVFCMSQSMFCLFMMWKSVLNFLNKVFYHPRETFLMVHEKNLTGFFKNVLNYLSFPLTWIFRILLFSLLLSLININPIFTAYERNIYQLWSFNI